MSNPSLSSIISKWLGTEAWIRDIDLISGLRDYVSDPGLHKEWKMVQENAALCLCLQNSYYLLLSLQSRLRTYR